MVKTTYESDLSNLVIDLVITLSYCTSIFSTICSIPELTKLLLNLLDYQHRAYTTKPGSVYSQINVLIMF